MNKRHTISDIRSARRIRRIRANIKGTPARPRLSLFFSNRHVYAQIVDDENAHTVAASSTVNQKLKSTLAAKAEWIGQDIAKKAKGAKVVRVVCDRRDRQYHTRVKAAAEAARAGGLEF